jgi:hypothetical protein
MQITYKLVVADYKAALALHNRQKSNRRSSHFFMFKVMPIIGILILCSDVILFFMRGDYFARNPPGLLIVPVVFSLLPVFRSYAIRKQFKGLFPRSQTDQHLFIDIDDERIISAMPGSSESKLLWNAIVRFAQDEKITLFYLTELRFLFVPTTIFSAEQRVELSNLVVRHVVKKTS